MASQWGKKKSGAFGAVGGGGRKGKEREEGRKRKRWAGADSDLRRWGLSLMEHGGKNAKKRAVVAVARKLAVLMHKLWVTGEAYEPLREVNQVKAAVV